MISMLNREAKIPRESDRPRLDSDSVLLTIGRGMKTTCSDWACQGLK